MYLNLNFFGKYETPAREGVGDFFKVNEKYYQFKWMKKGTNVESTNIDDDHYYTHYEKKYGPATFYLRCKETLVANPTNIFTERDLNIPG